MLAHNQQMEMNVETSGSKGEGNNPCNPGLASRQRLRWTHELHERFVEAVTQLGGPESEHLLSLFQSLCQHKFVFR